MNGDHVVVHATLLKELLLTHGANELLVLAALVVHVTVQGAFVLVTTIATLTGERFLDRADAPIP